MSETLGNGPNSLSDMIKEITESTKNALEKLKKSTIFESLGLNKITEWFRKLLGKQKEDIINNSKNNNNNNQNKEEQNNTPTNSQQENNTQNTEQTIQQKNNKTTEKQEVKNNESKEKEPKNTDIELIEKYIPGIKLDMRYATTNNFTHEKIYENSDAKLRYGTIKKLKKVQESLQKQGYSLKIRDAYRPQSAQEKFWKICPNPSLVANPKTGSNHTRGCAVDVTLVKSDGTELEMPSEFDDFNHKKLSDSDFSDVSAEKRKNAEILRKAMTENGFKGISSEWRHFDDTEKLKYPLIR